MQNFKKGLKILLLGLFLAFHKIFPVKSVFNVLVRWSYLSPMPLPVEDFLLPKL